MAPAHTRLVALLLDAAAQRGGQAQLAKALGIHETQLSNLINEKRHVTIRQALAIEDLLGVSGEQLWDEACIAKGRQAFAKARGGKS